MSSAAPAYFVSFVWPIIPGVWLVSNTDIYPPELAFVTGVVIGIVGGCWWTYSAMIVFAETDPLDGISFSGPVWLSLGKLVVIMWAWVVITVPGGAWLWILPVDATGWASFPEFTPEATPT